MGPHRQLQLATPAAQEVPAHPASPPDALTDTAIVERAPTVRASLAPHLPTARKAYLERRAEKDPHLLVRSRVHPLDNFPWQV